MAEAQKIHFELVSPEEKLIEQPFFMVAMPGDEGEFGVGLNHASLVASLKAGTVKLYENSLKDTPRRVFISGGFVDVAGDTCSLLAEEAIDFENLPALEDMKKELAQLQDDETLAEGEADKALMEARIVNLQAKIQAVSSK